MLVLRTRSVLLCSTVGLDHDLKSSVEEKLSQLKLVSRPWVLQYELEHGPCQRRYVTTRESKSQARIGRE